MPKSNCQIIGDRLHVVPEISSIQNHLLMPQINHFLMSNRFSKYTCQFARGPGHQDLLDTELVMSVFRLQISTSPLERLPA